MKETTKIDKVCNYNPVFKCMSYITNQVFILNLSIGKTTKEFNTYFQSFDKGMRQGVKLILELTYLLLLFIEQK